MSAYTVAADQAAVYSKSLTANTVDKVTFTRARNQVRVTNDSGSAEIWFRVDGHDPAVNDQASHRVGAVPGASVTVDCVNRFPGFHGESTVTVISTGTPSYTVEDATDTPTTAAVNVAHYTATNASLTGPAAADADADQASGASGAIAGLALIGEHGAPTDTPAQADWDAAVGNGTSTVACAILAAGSYVITVADRTTGNGTVSVGVIEPANVVTRDANSSGMTLVASAPVHLWAAAFSAATDLTRVFSVDVHVVKIG